MMERANLRFSLAPIKKLDDPIYDLSFDDDDVSMRIEDPVKGRDVRFSKVGEGLGTDYQGIRICEPKPALEDKDKLDRHPRSDQERANP